MSASNDPAPAAENLQELRLRTIEASIASMNASVTVLDQTLTAHLTNTAVIGKVVERSALDVLAASAETRRVFQRLFALFPDLGTEVADTHSELAQPVPERGTAERSRKDAVTMHFQKDLLMYALPLLGIIVAAFSVRSLHLSLVHAALAYFVLILVGGSWATTWVVSAFRELLKRPRR